MFYKDTDWYSNYQFELYTAGEYRLDHRWYFYTAFRYNHLVSINHLAGTNIILRYDSYIMSHVPWLIRTLSFRKLLLSWGSCREVIELHTSHIYASFSWNLPFSTNCYGDPFTFTDADTDVVCISKLPNSPKGIRSHKA